jgi:hypothetical protein
MKKRYFTLAFALVIIISGIFYGCTEDREKMVRTTNAIYLDIKTVVTDPTVKPMIPEKTLGRLVVVEQVYLNAAKTLKEPGIDSAEPLTIIINCADEILDTINILVLDEKYEKQLAVIRFSIKILKNHLQME